jgi:hypothetical protein
MREISTKLQDSVYALLDNSARSWWYHAQLRKQGNAQEARKRERQSIRRDVKMWREIKANGGYAVALHNRHLIFIGRGHMQSGYSPEETIALCRVLNVPVLDRREEDSIAGMPLGFDEGREWLLKQI